jgi:hypothetical protein
MTGANRDYYIKRAREARNHAEIARNDAVREKYAELAEIYEMCARRAPLARPRGEIHPA